MFLFRRSDRYILKEMLVPAAGGIVMVLLLLLGNVLYGLLLKLYEAKAPAGQVGMILAYQLPWLMMQAIPAALLVGTALALNRLERERELMAFRLTGTRTIRIIAPYLVLGLFFSGVLYVMQETVIPGTTRAANRMFYQLQWRNPVNLVPHDVVFRADNLYIYVREVDNTTQSLRDISVYRRELDGGNTFMRIPVARNINGEWNVMPDPVTNEPARLWSFGPKGDTINVIEVFGTGVLNLRKEVYDYLAEPPASPEELTLQQLLALRSARSMSTGTSKGITGMGGVEVSNAMSLQRPQITFWLHRKFAAPLAALIGILLAIPLAIRFGRAGGYVGLLVSGSVAFVYIVAQQWMQVLAVKSQPMLDPVLAAWGPAAVFGLIGIALLATIEWV